jgi:hypothetical protein
LLAELFLSQVSESSYRNGLLTLLHAKTDKLSRRPALTSQVTQNRLSTPTSWRKMGGASFLRTVPNDPRVVGQIPDFHLASRDYDGLAAPDSWHDGVAHELARKADGM